MSLGTPSPTGAPTSTGAASHAPVADVGLRRLQKVATIGLAGEVYDLAKNGGYHLVRSAGPDAYGHPVAEEISLHQFLSAPGGRFNNDLPQAILDALGEAYVRLQGQRDLRLGGEGGEP